MKVLVVEDVRLEREAMVQMISLWGYEVVDVPSAEAALKFLKKEKDDIIMLLDLGLPRIDGVELATMIRDELSHQNVHIITTSGRPDNFLRAHQSGLFGGANHFLPKPIDPIQLQLAIIMGKNNLDRIRTLVTQSTRDELTGAWNRREILRKLKVEMAKAKRKDEDEASPRVNLAVAIIDVNHFKWFNDMHGHPAGDEVLREISRRAEAADRISDEFGRLGGDEFLLLAPDCPEKSLKNMLTRIKRAVEKEPILLPSGELVKVSVSLGGAVSTRLTRGKNGESESEFIARADRALYRAKKGSGEIIIV